MDELMHNVNYHLYRVGQKVKVCHIFAKYWPIFIFSPHILWKTVTKWLLNISTHLNCVITLPREI